MRILEDLNELLLFLSVVRKNETKIIYVFRALQYLVSKGFQFFFVEIKYWEYLWSFLCVKSDVWNYNKTWIWSDQIFHILCQSNITVYLNTDNIKSKYTI